MGDGRTRSRAGCERERDRGAFWLGGGMAGQRDGRTAGWGDDGGLGWEGQGLDDGGGVLSLALSCCCCDGGGDAGSHWGVRV